MDHPTPAWRPTDEIVAHANLTTLMADGGFPYYEDLHRWTVLDPEGFWGEVIDQLGIVFTEPPEAVVSGPADDPTWLPGARMNIVDSCFTAPGDRTAVVFRRHDFNHSMSYHELRSEVNRFANGLEAWGVRPGDRVAIAMPMSIESVVAYLGTVAAGAVVVSIADSFAADEIATRLRLTEPVLVVTQDAIQRAGKELSMYDKVVVAGAPACVVMETGAEVSLRETDIAYAAFLSDETSFEAVASDPADHTNILFSSGTTGEPKAIPWTQITPIKAAMDGRYHQDIHAGDLIAWPTNLGWMMGPWLIYAALINDAGFALYDDLPTERGFVDFVAETGVTMLGVVPSIVAAWRSNGMLEHSPWSQVRVISSTGEASVAADYAWLMERAGGVPVIEYCGGTEIGGGYITGTVIQNAVPATFTTPNARHRRPYSRRWSRRRCRGVVSRTAVDRHVPVVVAPRPLRGLLRGRARDRRSTSAPRRSHGAAPQRVLPGAGEGGRHHEPEWDQGVVCGNRACDRLRRRGRRVCGDRGVSARRWPEPAGDLPRSQPILRPSTSIIGPKKCSKRYGRRSIHSSRFMTWSRSTNCPGPHRRR